MTLQEYILSQLPEEKAIIVRPDKSEYTPNDLISYGWNACRSEMTRKIAEADFFGMGEDVEDVESFIEHHISRYNSDDQGGRMCIASLSTLRKCLADLASLSRGEKK
jgi:hypothetical protein